MPLLVGLVGLLRRLCWRGFLGRGSFLDDLGLDGGCCCNMDVSY